MDKQPHIRVEEISKQFPGVLALDHVSVEAYAGEALALLGINGAGKSTLMNVIAGELSGDSGKILIDEKEVTIRNQKDAKDNRIALVHQEAVVFDNLTAAENVYVTVLDTYRKKGLLDFKAMYKDAERYMKMVNCMVPPDKKLSEVTVGDKQMVEIARALAMGADIILFDEPTSSLTINEKEHLFDIIRQLKAEGKTIIYITHFIDEALDISDRVCVMRDGKVVGKRMSAELTIEDIVFMMVGQKVATISNDTGANEDSDIVLDVRNLTNLPRVRDVSFSVRRGEVFGIWGLLGSGRTELFRALLGLDKKDSGELFLSVDGKMKKMKSRELLRTVGYVTENRHADGLFLQAPIWENISMPTLDRFTNGLFLDKKAEHQFGIEMIEKLSVKTPDENVRADKLSGGNQQRVIMARWIGKNPDIYFLDEPTRGVDVSAKAAIHQLILDIAKSGKTVVLVSSEIEEVYNLSDRIMVLRGGRKVDIVNKADVNHEKLMLMCVEEEAEVKNG